jgi:hypothetical protein
MYDFAVGLCVTVLGAIAIEAALVFFCHRWFLKAKELPLPLSLATELDKVAFTLL